MRTSVLAFGIAVAACDSNRAENLLTDCPAPGVLRYDHDVAGGGSGFVRITSTVFVNALDDLGVLDLQDGEDLILVIEFDELLEREHWVPARGMLTLTGSALDVGNCGAEPLAGQLAQDESGLRFGFRLEELRRAPYCTSAPVSGTITGCYHMALR